MISYSTPGFNSDPHQADGNVNYQTDTGMPSPTSSKRAAHACLSTCKASPPIAYASAGACSPSLQTPLSPFPPPAASSLCVCLREYVPFWSNSSISCSA